MMLMFIGASPGSTGGGIKTTTIAVLWSSIHAIITGKNRIVIFNRRLPFLVLNRALVIFVFSVAVISVAVLLLSITEKASVLKLAFEAISAYGTVGLTLGITGTLTLAGKAIIILLMFIGRIGALTLVFAITSPTDLPPVKVEYPTESVTIG
jgi:trk system potassium uptake protein TrkH